jgi:hypothetical protein
MQARETITTYVIVNEQRKGNDKMVTIEGYAFIRANNKTIQSNFQIFTSYLEFVHVNTFEWLLFIVLVMCNSMKINIIFVRLKPILSGDIHTQELVQEF